jgi:hypothetical protein
MHKNVTYMKHKRFQCSIRMLHIARQFGIKSKGGSWFALEYHWG